MNSKEFKIFKDFYLKSTKSVLLNDLKNEDGSLNADGVITDYLDHCEMSSFLARSIKQCAELFDCAYYKI